MWRKNAALLLLLPLMSALLSPGCATLTRKKTQRIPVTSAPAGATVSVNGTEQGTTPLAVRLARKQKGQVIRIESPGYNPAEIHIKRRQSIVYDAADTLAGVLVGIAAFNAIIRASEKPSNLLFLGLIPVPAGIFIGIDRGVGSGYELSPKDLTVTMTKADGTPRVDTMLVDAEDFQNIKWIRIQRD